MAQASGPFAFVNGRPCIAFGADGVTSVVEATCLIDCGGDYESCLYRHAVGGFLFTARLPNLQIVLQDGTTRIVRQAYLGIRWLGSRKHIVVRLMFAASLPSGVPNPGFAGYVGDKFFAAHQVCVDHLNGQVTVTAVINPQHP